MAKYKTPHLELNKWDGNDRVNIDELNENFEKLDSEVWTTKADIAANKTDINQLKTDVEQHSNDIENLTEKVGDLTTLKTTNKNSTVAAINEHDDKIGILSRDLEDIASRVGGGTGGTLEAQSIKLGTHLFEHYQIPGEDTELVTVERDGENYTIFEIAAPTREVNGNAEATLTLMRRNDPETGAPEFMDLYNINYPDGKQMGIRIQTRGAGTLRDFVIDFNRGTVIQEAMRVKPDKDIIYHGNARYRSADDQIIEFQDINGNRAAYFGRIVSTPKKRVLLVNSVGGNSVELHDNGSTVFYSPTGDFYVYLDSGSMFVNDSRVQTQDYTTLKSPDGSIWKAEIDNSGTVTWVKQG